METKIKRQEDISEKLKQEYAAFGPWIYEIKKPIDIPTVFEEAVELTDDMIIGIKIPEDIERRHAKEGMHLYNYVLILKEQHLEIHQRQNNEVISNSMSYDDVVAISYMENLLKGQFTIYHKTGATTLTYSTTSNDIIEKVVGIIRSKLPQKEQANPTPYKDEALVEMSFLFKSLLKKAEQKEDIHILDFQPKISTKKINPSFLEQLSYIFFKYELQASLYLTSGHDLLVFHRSNEVLRANIADYSHGLTIIPFSSIKGISVEDNEEYINMKNLVIQIMPYPIVFKMGNTVDFSSWIKTII